MRHAAWPAGTVRPRWRLPLLMPVLLLAGCAVWTHPAPSSVTFADDATACHQAAADAARVSGQFDLDEDNAYTACMQRKGWEIQER